jgi:hypothetical protein
MNEHIPLAPCVFPHSTSWALDIPLHARAGMSASQRRSTPFEASLARPGHQRTPVHGGISDPSRARGANLNARLLNTQYGRAKTASWLLPALSSWCTIQMVRHILPTHVLTAARSKDVREEQEHAVLNLTGLHLCQVRLSLLGGSVKSCGWCSVDTRYILIP